MPSVRTLVVLVLAVRSLASCAIGAPGGGEAGRPPNIIVFFADDMGMGDVGAYGSEDIPTPNIDSIAANGVRFTNGYVSCPQCAPSRAALMTGRYQNRFGFEYNYNNAIEEDQADAGLPLTEATIASRLKSVGYTTGVIGKWHLGWDASEKFHPLNRGYDYFFGMLEGSGGYMPREGMALSRSKIFRNHDRVKTEAYLTDVFGDEVVSFIERHKADPFFLYVPFNAPHTPLEATEEYLERAGEHESEKRKIYSAMVISMDDAIGAALEKLRAEGLSDNTMVFFLTDNGGQERQGGDNGIYRAGKGSMYEGGIRVPFVVQWPAVYPAGVSYDAAVTSRDILPTAIGAAGVESKADLRLDGTDITPFLLDAGRDGPHASEPLCWRLAVRPRGPDDIPWAVRLDNWKLVGVKSSQRGGANKSGVELYDLSKDPREEHNVATDHPDVVERLRAAYAAWESEMADPAWELKPAG
ncbi:MAG: hypothetical protein CMJ31_02370 [Phycisphaerae bacterium]|nr:hypothetical protein [Phycisphaerae bacterium]